MRFMKLFLLLSLFSACAHARTANQTYRMPSTGNIPGWGAIALGSSAAVTGESAGACYATGSSSGLLFGTLIPIYGGTGIVSATAHGVVLGEGTAPFDVLTPGTMGLGLVSNGASSDPSWQAIVTDPTTTLGDLLYRGVSGLITRLGIGSTSNVLTVAGGIPSWGQVNLASSAAVTGITPQVNGGTGANNITSGGTGGSSGPAITSGQYTPSSAASSNFNSIGWYPTVWSRVGNTVTVFGRVDLSFGGTPPGTVNVVLPTSTANFPNIEQASGSGVGDTGSGSGTDLTIAAVPGTQNVQLKLTGNLAIGTTVFGYTYSYAYTVQ